jgi:hypothetical protein
MWEDMRQNMSFTDWDEAKALLRARRRTHEDRNYVRRAFHAASSIDAKPPPLRPIKQVATLRFAFALIDASLRGS